jgi:hypothetical protein
MICMFGSCILGFIGGLIVTSFASVLHFLEIWLLDNGTLKWPSYWLKVYSFMHFELLQSILTPTPVVKRGIFLVMGSTMHFYV